MSKSKKYLLIKQLLTSIILALIGCTSVVFTVLYLNTFESGFCYLYSTVITAISVSIISILTVLSITFLRYKKEIVYKILSLFVVLIFLYNNSFNVFRFLKVLKYQCFFLLNITKIILNITLLTKMLYYDIYFKGEKII